MAARVIVGTEKVLREAGGPSEVPEGAYGRKGGRLWVCSRPGQSESPKITSAYKKHRKKQRTVHVATLMDICHLKHAESEPTFQKYKGRVVLQGDIVKDDSSFHAVFTDQGSFASQMTAAKINVRHCKGYQDVTCSRRSISLHHQVKMEDAPHLLKLPKPRHKWPESWSNIEAPVVLLD